MEELPTQEEQMMRDTGLPHSAFLQPAVPVLHKMLVLMPALA
jgi:catechol-2,3-dioxygenase